MADVCTAILFFLDFLHQYKEKNQKNYLTQIVASKVWYFFDTTFYFYIFVELNFSKKYQYKENTKIIFVTDCRLRGLSLMLILCHCLRLLRPSQDSLLHKSDGEQRGTGRG